MADGYIDLSPIINAVNRAINSVNNNISRVDNNLGIVNSNLELVRRQTMTEISNVKKQLKEMEKQQKFQSALQIATTEVIRVRQELDNKFGTHKLVRDYMLGILQATDLGLITESTISRCTEELMISAPKYWLAPCLIALAGWISNNESLAKRAIKEAVKRDKEKTYLLFALISRRVNVGRLQAGQPASNTTFEWLAEYFQLQDPRRMKKSVIAFIDAYTNGVFGEDKDNVCQDHIYAWMDELKSFNPNFVEEQKNYWLNIFNGYCSGEAVSSYGELAKICAQYDDMKNYLLTIDAAQREDKGIKTKFKGIMDANVDYNQLVNAIDEQLTRLVSNYEEEETDLRDSEQYFEYVKKFKGDELRADNLMKAIKNSRIDVPVDFAQRLAASILDEYGATASEKKTAVYLLRPYINEAFNAFITANKDAYPKEVDLKIAEEGRTIGGERFVWEGKTENAENREELVTELTSKYDTAKSKTVAKITDDAANKKVKTGKILTATLIFAVLPIGPFMWYKGKKALQENENQRTTIKRYYDNAKVQNVDLLNKALDERVEANEVVNNFLADESNETIKL